MNTRPTKQVVLITGTSSGFGRNTAETLARVGHTVYASMRDSRGRNKGAADSLRALARAEQVDLRIADLDVASADSVQQATDSIVKEAGSIDVLVNNAGTLSVGITEGFTEEQAISQFDTNVIGVLRTIRAVLPGMRRRRSGLIINVGSIVGRLVFPFFGIYGATKFALEALTESYRYELSQLGVDVVLVQPSAFETEMFSKIQAPRDAGRQGEYGDVLKFQQRLVNNLGVAISGPNAPKPQAVADAIAKLVVQPAGQRPPRAIVGADFGAQQINDHTAPIQSSALASLGLADLSSFQQS
jgi:NAD(P)-dependent dehydrogenase (short-subunit alcohol dehydrogenase family)